MVIPNVLALLALSHVVVAADRKTEAITKNVNPGISDCGRKVRANKKKIKGNCSVGLRVTVKVLNSYDRSEL